MLENRFTQCAEEPYFGAQLQQSGQEVIFVARGEQRRVLSKQGITVHSDQEEVRLQPVVVTDDIATIGPVDYVLICVKTWQLGDVVPKLPLLKGIQSRFLTLQNGVEAPQIVAESIGASHTLAGLVRGFFQMEAPGKVQHVGVQPAIVFGQLDLKRTPEADILRQCLLSAGVYVDVSDDIEAALWEKFLLVTSLGGVGAVTRSTSVRSGIAWLPGKCFSALWARSSRWHGHMGFGYPVMWSSARLNSCICFRRRPPPRSNGTYMNGYPSELEAQAGAVVRRAHGCYSHPRESVHLRQPDPSGDSRPFEALRIIFGGHMVQKPHPQRVQRYAARQ